MAPTRDNRIVVIVGETASGKSNLALRVARQWEGEIIAADSRTVYKGMDIGTAKPTLSERARVPHHLIDVIDPDERFTAADFQSLARTAISDIQSRSKVPIVAGGTGLYLDALLYNFQFRESPDLTLRNHLQTLSIEDLQQKIISQGLNMPLNKRNPRHLAGIIEAKGLVAHRSPLLPHTLLIGLHLQREELEHRVIRRVKTMFASGLEAEVKNLVNRYGWDTEALKAIGYREFKSYLEGEQTREQVEHCIIRDTLMYAKRQRTWFNRNADIQWYDTAEQAFVAIGDWLSKKEPISSQSLVQ